MPPTSKQRTLVWSGVLAFLIYLVASDWHSLRDGLGGFPPFLGLMLLLGVAGVARNLYWPAPRRPRWVEVLTWAVVAPMGLYIAFLGLRPPLEWHSAIWSVLMIVLAALWSYAVFHPHGKLWRAFHPSEWNAGRENPRR